VPAIYRDMADYLFNFCCGYAECFSLMHLFAVVS